MNYNYIRIHKKPNAATKVIAVKNRMFEYDVVIDVYVDSVIFTEYTIDNPRTPTSFTHTNSGWFQCTTTNDILPFGKFKIDKDESTEGRLVVYYEDVIED